MNRPETLYILLPFYNEGPNLEKMVESITRVSMPDGGKLHIVAVDDGSNDGSGDYLKALKDVKGVPVSLISHTKNRGLPAAMDSGFRHCLRVGGDADVIVTLDADMSHRPEQIIQLKAALDRGADLAVASRYIDGAEIVGLSALRIVISAAANLLYRTLFPIETIRDYTCNFRAYRLSIIRRFYGLYGDEAFPVADFSAVPDMLIRMRRLGIRGDEIPLILRFDLKESTSKTKIIKGIYKSSLLILRRIFRGA
jgi:dolichol-phosphate mannosyltransferase